MSSLKPAARADLVVATRGSKLALAQTHALVDRLRAAHTDLTVEVREMVTTGDKRSEPLPEIGGKGLFTAELEEALLNGDADLAVHSLKDLPTTLPEGLALGAVPEREDPRDALVLRDPGEPDDEDTLRILPVGARVGTSSTRRHAFLRHRRPDLVIEPVRGNLDTRLRKLDEGQYDALVLAAAGLNRLGWSERITMALPPEVCVPAPAQGALGLEVRAGDERSAEILAVVDDPATRAAVTAERAFLAAFGGGCSLPCGAHAAVEGTGLVLTGAVAQADGTELMTRAAVAPQEHAEDLGRRLAESLLAEGAGRLLEPAEPVETVS